MTKKEKGALERRPIPNTVVHNDSSETSLEALRAQYLAEIFALSPSTAAVVAELAFGGSSR
jgi:hypothetical protein